MVIEFETKEQFERLLRSLTGEQLQANINWRLYTDITSSWGEYEGEFLRTHLFWSLTIGALIDATLFRLIRVYDGHIESLSLRNLLDTISANLHLFEDHRFRERLRNSPFAQSLADDARMPDENQLSKDIEFASSRNPTVKKLIVLRNTLYVHSRAKNIVKGIRPEYPLSDEEIQDLTVTGMTILNRYIKLFRGYAEGTRLVGADDFKLLLESVRNHLGPVEGLGEGMMLIAMDESPDTH